MPNLCFFDMHAKGAPSALDAFENHFDYDAPPYFARVFDFSRYGEHLAQDGDVVRCYFGNCAWSLESCVVGNSPFSYAARSNDIARLQDVCAALGVEVEAIATESGCGFAEHYVVDASGQMLVNEEHPYFELFYDEDDYSSFSEFLCDNDLDPSLTEDDLDENGDLVVCAIDVRNPDWRF